MRAPTENARLNAPKTWAVEIEGVSAATMERSTVMGVMKNEMPTPAKGGRHRGVSARVIRHNTARAKVGAARGRGTHQ